MMLTTPITLLLLLSQLGGDTGAERAQLDFSRDVRPILAENCFHCHGRDEAARKGDLRLDNVEGARFVIDVDDPAESELLLRIFSEDRTERMPPPKAKRVLSDADKAVLREWVHAGAEYAEHWAFVPPTRATAAVLGADVGTWAKNPIDGFVARRLQQVGLEPSAAAHARQLLRRLSLDLIGLPPAPAEGERFAVAHALDADAAVDAAVTRLLESPRFGEKWARSWLDLARYADSNGFQADQLRPSWAYRDWVIRALNANMPFDQFTIEQLAGDLLEDASLEQKIATGFHRGVTCNVEAGVHAEENRVNQVIDRVNTTATVWLGLTLECAQCHDHKYDPFSMKDYYGLFAYFNNTPLEVETPSGVTDVSHDFIGPYLDLPMEPERVERKASLEQVLAELQASREEALAAGTPAWSIEARKSLAKVATWQVLEILSFSSTGQEEIRLLDDGSVLLVGPVPDKVSYEIELRSPLDTITMFKLEALTHAEIPGKGPGRGDPERTNFVLTEIELRVGEELIDLDHASADFSQDSWMVAGAVDGKPKSGWAIAPQFGRDHWMTFLPAQPFEAREFSIELHQNWGRGRVLGRVRLSVSDGDPAAQVLPDKVAQILMKAEEELSQKELNALAKHFGGIDAAIIALDRSIAERRAALNLLKPDRTLVMVELQEPRATHVLERGNYLSPGAAVQARTLSSLHKTESAHASNRLGLAEWLVDPANPLTARVVVNRWWAELFGHGIVKTIEDFGAQSDAPTHPELLDWLALELVGSGWDMKHVLKAIVTSATYRQDSRLTPELMERDPRNELYARGARFRLPAETIRDNALAAAGLLSDKMYGPPVMPYQPPGIWHAVGRNAPKWEAEQDEDRFRRGIYVVWRRAAPYPSFVTFDAPDRATCTVSRPRTNTALQALALLNDPAYFEAALALADRALVESPDDPLGRAFELVLCRPMEPAEREVLSSALDERRAYYQEHPNLAKQTVQSAEGVFHPTTEDRTLLAAHLHMTHILLNLDETVTRE